MTANIAQASDTLVASDAWIPQAPPGAGTMAGYLELKNSGNHAVGVVSAKSDRFGEVTLHRTEIADGMARMRPLSNVVIAPGETFSFVPGGNHLMLMEPVSAVVPGEKISIDFALSDGGTLRADFDVRAAGEAAGDAHEHHH
jgi:hypothetical protein